MEAPSIPVDAWSPRLYPTKLSFVFSSTFKASPLPVRAPPNCTLFLAVIYTSEVSGLCLLTISGGSFTSSKNKRLLSSKKSVVPGGNLKLIRIKLREVSADFAPSDSRFPSVTMVPFRKVVDSPLLNSISSVRVNVLSLMIIIKLLRLLPFIRGRTTSNTLPAAPVPPRVSFFPIAIWTLYNFLYTSLPVSRFITWPAVVPPEAFGSRSTAFPYFTGAIVFNR